MIVMGTHGYGWSGRTSIGSITQHVMAEIVIPVLLIK